MSGDVRGGAGPVRDQMTVALRDVLGPCRCSRADRDHSRAVPACPWHGDRPVARWSLDAVLAVPAVADALAAAERDWREPGCPDDCPCTPDQPLTCAGLRALAADYCGVEMGEAQYGDCLCQRCCERALNERDGLRAAVDRVRAMTDDLFLRVMEDDYGPDAAEHDEDVLTLIAAVRLVRALGGVS